MCYANMLRARGSRLGPPRPASPATPHHAPPRPATPHAVPDRALSRPSVVQNKASPPRLVPTYEDEKGLKGRGGGGVGVGGLSCGGTHWALSPPVPPQALGLYPVLPLAPACLPSRLMLDSGFSSSSNSSSSSSPGRPVLTALHNSSLQHLPACPWAPSAKAVTTV